MTRLEICAELSANHLGYLSRALTIVDAAAAAGADLFKVQVWTPGTMCVDKGYTLDSGPWAGRKLFDLYEEAWTPWEWLPTIFARARAKGLIPFGAAFDLQSVEYLEDLGVDRHKVASFELTDLPLIRHMASKGKPMLLSTGMATRDEIEQAGKACKGAKPVTILQCTSAYPADPKDANLLAGRQFIHWGLSDHTRGIGVACAAAAMGAEYIEKHLTLNRADGGPDAGFSLEPHEFSQMVAECRSAAASVGHVEYGCGPNESTALRRSLWVCKDIGADEEIIFGDNVITARPATGLPASFETFGMRAIRDLRAGTPLTQDCIA